MGVDCKKEPNDEQVEDYRRKVETNLLSKYSGEVAPEILADLKATADYEAQMLRGVTVEKTYLTPKTQSEDDYSYKIDIFNNVTPEQGQTEYRSYKIEGRRLDISEPCLEIDVSEGPCTQVTGDSLENRAMLKQGNNASYYRHN
tara:strand:- start:328 stop:759 length:432 start_codon:yes stop_codon:yes gene_type:complete